MGRCAGYNCGCSYHVRALMRRDADSERDFAVLILVSAAYCINRFWLRETVRLPLISYILKCYFNDWLAGIGMIAYLNLLRSVSSLRRGRVEDIPSAAFVCFICGLLWEYALPALTRHGTSDPWDIAAYILGGISYVLISHTYRQHCFGYKRCGTKKQ